MTGPQTGLRPSRALVLGVVAVLAGPLAALALTTGSAVAGTVDHPSTGAVAIPPSGPADPYPSAIIVDQPGAITHVAVTLHGFEDSFPHGVSVVLQGPNGDALMLMSGVSDSLVGGVGDLTFDDAGATQLPDSGSYGTGTYRPTAYDLPTLPTGDDPVYGPGPGADYGNPGPAEGGTDTLASAFNGDAASGAWKLWVADDNDQSGDDGGTIPSWTLSITTAPTFTLSVAAGGTGGGTVYGPGIRCPGDCSQAFAAGTAVTLVAVPASGSHFSGWAGACAGTAPCSLTIGGDATVNATLDRNPRTENPQTYLLDRPDKRTHHHLARFTFSADEPDVSFECAIDGSGYHRCAPGVRFRGLDAGRHHFRVRAVNEFGNTDSRPAAYVWRVFPG